MTTPRSVEPVVVARAVNSRLWVGHLTQAGQAITLTQTDTTTCGPTCPLAARLLLAPGGRAVVTDDLAQEVTVSPPGQEDRQLVSVLSRQQLRLQRVMNVRDLGVLPWPKALGSTPWSMARQVTEIASVCASGGGRRRYTVRWASDHSPVWGSKVASIREVLAGGLPVILVIGGPLVLDTLAEGEPTARARLRASPARSPAVPHHYVLALPWWAIGQEDPDGGCARIHESSSGAVRPLDLTVSRDPYHPGLRKLGSWPRVLTVIAPED